MLKRICDRCGRDISEMKEFYRVYTYKVESNCESTGENKEYDLCINCRNSFFRYLDEWPEE